MNLTWDEFHDESDNAYYEASSPYGDDGSPFRWRIKPALRADKVVWHLDESDDECLPNDDKGDEYATIEAAKAQCEAWYSEIVAAELERDPHAFDRDDEDSDEVEF